MRCSHVLIVALLAVVPEVGAGPVYPVDCGFKMAGIEVDCGFIKVLEDRSKPAGRTIPVHFVRARASGDTPRADPIVFLGGGPGMHATPGAEGMLRAPITQGRLELGQSGSPLAQSDGKVLGVIRTGTACPPQPGTSTSVPTLVHNWLHGPSGSRLVDHLAAGDTSVRSLPARE